MFDRSGMELETFAMEATRFLDQEDVLLVWATANRRLEYMTLMMDRYPSTNPVFQVNDVCQIVSCIEHETAYTYSHMHT